MIMGNPEHSALEVLLNQLFLVKFVMVNIVTVEFLVNHTPY